MSVRRLFSHLSISKNSQSPGIRQLHTSKAKLPDVARLFFDALLVFRNSAPPPLG